MNHFSELIIANAVEKVRHKVQPMLDKMSDEERSRCAEIMKICLDAVLEATTTADMANRQAVAHQRARVPTKSAFDKVMNVVTFGLWD